MTMGTCTDPLPDGAMCVRDEACAGGRCNDPPGGGGGVCVLRENDFCGDSSGSGGGGAPPMPR